MNHRRLPALRRDQRATQIQHVPPDKLHIDRLTVILSAPLQRQEDRHAELVRAQLGLHAFLQVMRVAGVAEAGLDLADFGVGAADEGLDEEFPPGSAGLVVVVGPVGLGFPPAQGGGVAGFPEGAIAEFEFDVLRDVDTLAVELGVVLVFSPEREDLVAGEVGEDGDQGLGVDMDMMGEGLFQSDGVGSGVVERYPLLIAGFG